MPSQLELLKSKNATLATVPSLSLAVAVRLMFVGPAKLAPLAGLVMLTVGGLFGGGALALYFFTRINAPKRGNVLAPVGLAARTRARCYHAGSRKIPGLRCRGNGRPTIVLPGTQHGVASRGLFG